MQNTLRGWILWSASTTVPAQRVQGPSHSGVYSLHGHRRTEIGLNEYRLSTYFYWHHNDVIWTLCMDLLNGYNAATQLLSALTITLKKVIQPLGFLKVHYNTSNQDQLLFPGHFVRDSSVSEPIHFLNLSSGQIHVPCVSTIKYPSLISLCIYLLVSYMTRMMYPNQFVEPLAPTGAQLQPYMKTVICFLYRNTTEVPVFVVVNWFLCKEKKFWI